MEFKFLLLSPLGNAFYSWLLQLLYHKLSIEECGGSFDMHSLNPVTVCLAGIA